MSDERETIEIMFVDRPWDGQSGRYFDVACAGGSA